MKLRSIFSLENVELRVSCFTRKRNFFMKVPKRGDGLPPSKYMQHGRAAEHMSSNSLQDRLAWQKGADLNNFKIHKYLNCLPPAWHRQVLCLQIESSSLRQNPYLQRWRRLKKRTNRGFPPGLHSNMTVTMLSNVLRTQVMRLLISFTPS